MPHIRKEISSEFFDSSQKRCFVEQPTAGGLFATSVC
jgi:hypothetical protein